MADPFGVYDALINTAYSNQNAWMREQAALDLVKAYDSLFSSPLQDRLYPRTAAPKNSNGYVPSVDTPFYIPTVSDVGNMSRFYDYFESPPPHSPGFEKEEMTARMTKESGPITNPMEYADEFRTGLLEKRNQIVLQDAQRAITRFVEYNLVHYSRGTQATMQKFGNQYTKQIATNPRLKTFDMTSDLTGVAWDGSTAKPLADINTIDAYISSMSGSPLAEIYLGMNAAAGLENNADLKDLLKYQVDYTQHKISASLKGVNLVKIIGQNYKDDSANSGRIGYPGMGDVRRDGWTTRRQIKMMVDSGTEFAFAVTKSLGNVYTARVHPKQTDTNSHYPREWTDPRTGAIFSEVSFGFAPYVYDFANIIVLNKIATATV